MLTSLEQLKAGKTQIREFGRKTDLKAKNKELARHSVIAFTDSAWEGYLYWQEKDPKLAEKINELIDAYMDSPTTGIGRPEPLKGT